MTTAAKRLYHNFMRKNIRRLLKYGQLTAAVLNHIIESILAGYSAIEARRGVSLTKIIEGAGFLLESIKEEGRRRKKILRVVRNLEKKQIINLEEKGDKVFIYLKDKNHPKVIEYSIKALLEFKRKKQQWSGKWFLVFFDVPEIQRNKRDYLRRFLKMLGFYQYQQSVYIFPYECEKEIALIKKIVEGAKYMKYVVAEKIEEEEKIKRYFSL